MASSLFYRRRRGSIEVFPRRFLRSVLFAGVLLVAGCYVPSVQPFFTRDAVMHSPPVSGLWVWKGEVYEFSHRIERRAGKGISGPIERTFFRVEG